MAIAIAAAASGSGKTTIALALLAALQRRGLRVQSFKVGPDYIDPGLHWAATQLPCRNLDPFLTSEDYVRRCFAYHCQGKDAAVVEGVMGLFDGKVGADDFASTAHVSRLLDLPTVLVLDAQKVGRTVAAIAYGLMQFDPRVAIAGIIFNRVGSPRHAQLLQEAIAPLHIPVLGIVYSTPDIHMPSRHLGLVPAGEQANFSRRLDRLAQLAEVSLNWDLLLPLVQALPQPRSLWPDVVPGRAHPTIAVARDAAFNFYYADNLDLLEHLGANLQEFSPLDSGFSKLDDCSGLYLGGGFPEVFAAQLSEQLQAHPLPDYLPIIYAECGGLMVLGQQLDDREGKTYPMAGQLPYSTQMTHRLTLGYRSATAIADSPMIRAGETVRGHEFHHSVCVSPVAREIYRGEIYRGEIYRGEIYRWDDRREGWGTEQVHASYLHVHWGSQTQLAQRWLQTCDSTFRAKHQMEIAR
ncbi:cobyrinate a,c-diamide synthase [Synechococcus sp. PCC 7336]|uniref:cobyrinate a,c-diamide synthase n=1 Tax=Synechococcus sp. PCC 7336 TaxID=195250 RepID=UPI00034B9E68|nr:cobyrinate a,c-diamide synthase [Synechococcus sp. PCC 7336]